jgi:hypothetical protein
MGNHVASVLLWRRRVVLGDGDGYGHGGGVEHGHPTFVHI